MKLPNILTKKTFRISGIIGLLIAAALLITGAAGIFGNYSSRDSEGFYTAYDISVIKGSYAVVIPPESMEISPGREVFGLSVFKIEVSNSDPSKPLFMGTAHKFDVERYFKDSEYDEITNLYIFPTRVDYQTYSGSRIPGTPDSQKFWVESVNGTGTQIYKWEIEPDRSTLLIMNESGDAGIDMNITIGAKANLLNVLGSGNIFIGIGLLLGSLLMLTFAGKTRNISYPQPLG
ncbi:hypothetical protein ACFLYQ_04810 [Chloroflexota bacterium]